MEANNNNIENNHENQPLLNQINNNGRFSHNSSNFSRRSMGAEIQFGEMRQNFSREEI